MNQYNAPNLDFEAIATLLNKMVQELFSILVPSCTAEDLPRNSAPCLEISFRRARPAHCENSWGIVWGSSREHTNNKESE